jgi:hypothetical protein
LRRRRDLIVANSAALLVLAAALLLGWWDAALFGLVVLILVNLLALVRELGARASARPREADGRSKEEATWQTESTKASAPSAGSVGSRLQDGTER